MWPNDPLVSSLAVAIGMRAELVGQALPASLQGLYERGSINAGLMIGHYPGILGQGPRHRMWMDSTASTVFASTGAINYVGVYPFMAAAYYISSSLREYCPHCGEPQLGMPRSFLNGASLIPIERFNFVATAAGH